MKRVVLLWAILAASSALAATSLPVAWIPQVPPGDWNHTKNCGPASLVMGACYVKGQTPSSQGIVDVDNHLGLDSNGGSGTSCDQLIESGGALWGLSLSKHYWGLDELRNELSAGRPVVVAVWAADLQDPHDQNAGDHFVLVVGFDDNHILCNDPGTSYSSYGDHWAVSNSNFAAAMAAENGAVVTGFGGSDNATFKAYPGHADSPTLRTDAIYMMPGEHRDYVFYCFNDGSSTWPASGNYYFRHNGHALGIGPGADSEHVDYTTSPGNAWTLHLGLIAPNASGQTYRLTGRMATKTGDLYHEFGDYIDVDVHVGPAWDGHLDGPTSGDTVSGTVKVSGWAKETTGHYPPVAVELVVNGSIVQTHTYGDPATGAFSFDWDSRPYAGSDVSVTARPTTGTVWWDGLTANPVHVGPAWEGHLDAPTSGSTVSGTVHVSGWAKETSGKYTPVAVELVVNGAIVQTHYNPPSDGTFSFDWDSLPYAGSDVSITARPTTGTVWWDGLTANPVTVVLPPPTVLKAKYINATHVDVLFSASLDSASAQTATNYKISPTRGITAAVLDTDSKTVHLTTASQAEGTTYTVTVSGVKSAAGTPIVTGSGDHASWLAGVPPTVQSATFVDSAHVDVLFSRTVGPATSQTAANYKVSSALKVISAVRDADLKTVHLTTGPQVDAKLYTLTVSGVKSETHVPIVKGSGDSAQWTANFPMLKSVVFVNLTHVDLLFSRSVGSSLTYSISPTLAVTAAVRDVNTTTMHLTTATQTDLTTYAVTVSGGGTGKSSWTADLPPKIAGATYVDATHVDVVFSKAMGPVTSQTATNYKVAPALAVTAAVRDADLKTVHLTTATQVNATKYKVTASGVKSVAGTPIVKGSGDSASWTAGASGVPNPASVTVTAAAAPTSVGAQIMVNLTAAAEVTVTIRNLAGREIAVLTPGQLQAGVRSLLWNGKSSAGTKVPAGMYLLQVSANGANGTSAQAVSPLQLR